MSPHDLARQQRQRELLVRSALLRVQLAEDSLVLQNPLALADQVRAGWQWLRAHPEAPLAAAAVVLVLRPRRVLRWSSRLWWAWQSLRRVQSLLMAPRR